MERKPVSRFLSWKERRRRIEVVLNRRRWTWYKLSKEMGMNQTAVQRSLKNPPLGDKNLTLEVAKRLARATGTTVGFWVDRRESR